MHRLRVLKALKGVTSPLPLPKVDMRLSQRLRTQRFMEDVPSNHRILNPGGRAPPTPPSFEDVGKTWDLVCLTLIRPKLNFETAATASSFTAIIIGHFSIIHLLLIDLKLT